ncbi:MAG: carbamoyl phosphate synthase small subunit [Acidimicrobiales bacterium]|nr:MAG: carbamoyl phosphate synthase small subunit [Acidimicrobiales bacterium]
MTSDALLVLADGAVFEGEAAGAWPSGGMATGELVFNTVMSGYQEVITDPSYSGQIVAFTYPHIGNYGVAPPDAESSRPHCRGIVVRELAGRRSNWRSVEDLGAYLARHGVAAITGVDTRRLTRHIRQAGSMGAAFGPVDITDDAALLAAARAEPGTDGMDLVAGVTTATPYRCGHGPFKVVAYDFGVKSSMLGHLGALATVEVVPASTPAGEVLAGRPDGVFLSNGPGDPAALGYAVDAISGLLGEVPIFGICMGYQLLAVALGGSSFKLAFGHHGGNHPVRRLATGAVEITSHNHSYAVAEDSLEGTEISHIDLNDGVVEGIRAPGQRAFGVQYHPEAGPGPHDARYLFEEFRALMAGSAGVSGAGEAGVGGGGGRG